MEELLFRPSRKKWISRLIFAIAGFIFGFALAYVFAPSLTVVWSWVFLILGHILIIYCIIMILMSRQALSVKNNGLEFSKFGITDKSSIIGYGQIAWKEIEEIVIRQQNNKYKILVMVKKPKKFIKSASNGAIKTLRQKNLEEFGTPVFFESDHFDFVLVDLENFLKARKIRYSKN